jgi:hypothetical protein
VPLVLAKYARLVGRSVLLAKHAALDGAQQQLQAQWQALCQGFAGGGGRGGPGGKATGREAAAGLLALSGAALRSLATLLLWPLLYSSDTRSLPRQHLR